MGAETAADVLSQPYSIHLICHRELNLTHGAALTKVHSRQLSRRSVDLAGLAQNVDLLVCTSEDGLPGK